MENVQMTNNITNFDNGINQAINAVVRGDIREFQQGFSAAIDCKIVEKIRDVRNDAIRESGFLVDKIGTDE